MMRLRNLLLLCVLSAACDVDAPQDDVFETEQAAARGHRDERARPRPPTARDAGAADTCDSLKESARTLLESKQQCSVDADCIASSVAAPCLLPFLCSVPVARSTDLVALAREAGEVSRAYRQKECACPVARCASPESLRTFCDATTKRCEIALRTASDADAGAAPVDAGSAIPDAGSAPADAGPFSCAKDSDCAVKNVGNCCGYYPRCANVGATFSQPNCPGGGASVCGFPTIDACTCRNNTCVALQSGREI